jgi:hypothetical protein
MTERDRLVEAVWKVVNSLQCTVAWLDAGCDAREAANELRIDIGLLQAVRLAPLSFEQIRDRLLERLPSPYQRHEFDDCYMDDSNRHLNYGDGHADGFNECLAQIRGLLED